VFAVTAVSAGSIHHVDVRQCVGQKLSKGLRENDVKANHESGRLSQAEINEDKEKDKEIASAAMALLLAAITVIVISPLVLYTAHLFNSTIFNIR
jgi:hypothetical protein